MQVLLIILVVLAVILAVFLAARAHKSRSKTVPETPSDSLAPCPITPNCVCSETGTASSHAVEPLRLRVESGEQVIPRLIGLVEDLGGEVVHSDDRVVQAVFLSGVFGFADDLAFRVDPDNAAIHIRSASRVGTSDLGANRKRVEQLRRRWEAENGS